MFFGGFRVPARGFLERAQLMAPFRAPRVASYSGNM